MCFCICCGSTFSFLLPTRPKDVPGRHLLHVHSNLISLVPPAATRRIAVCCCPFGVCLHLCHGRLNTCVFSPVIIYVSSLIVRVVWRVCMWCLNIRVLRRAEEFLSCLALVFLLLCTLFLLFFFPLVSFCSKTMVTTCFFHWRLGYLIDRYQSVPGKMCPVLVLSPAG